MMKRYTITLLLLFFILIPSGVVFAGGATDRVVEPDDVIPNDVTIFDDNLEIKAGGRVNGDVVVWNGNANVAGTVRGDLIVINGDLDLEDVAEVRGECVVVNGQLNNDEDSNVTCTTVSGLPEIPGLGNLLNEIPNIPTETSVPVKHVDSLWVNLAEAVGQTLFFGFLAYVIASLLPQHMARIEDTMRSNPVASGGIGLLTSVAVPILIVLLALISSVLVIICIGILGFPIVLAMALALVAASFLGWVTVGNLVGVWAAAKLNLENRNLKTTAVLGTMLLTFVFGMLGAVPWVMGEGIVSFFAMCMGLGAVALTKFGTRAYPLVAVAEPDDDKITAVLNTLPDDEEPAE